MLCATVQPCLPARRGFTEDRIGFIDGDHRRCGFRSGVSVGMKLHCKQPIGLMNFFEAGPRPDAEHFVIVRSSLTSGVTGAIRLTNRQVAGENEIHRLPGH